MLTTQRLVVLTLPSPTALRRVVSVCAGCQCAILELQWSSDRSGGQIDITVRGPDHLVRPLEARLRALVEVLEVDVDLELACPDGCYPVAFGMIGSNRYDACSPPP